MERCTADPQVSQSALQQEALGTSNSAESAANAGEAGMSGLDSARAAPRVHRAEDARDGSATRVRRAIERLQRQPGQTLLQSQPQSQPQPQPHSAGNAFNDSHDVALSRLVELEIIPRLMLLHGSSTPARSESASLSTVFLGAVHVEALARLAAEGDAGAASAYARALLDAGASLEQIYLDLLGPTAKLLGTRWEDDVYDFSVVTIALWRLQQVVYEQGSRMAPSRTPPGSGQRALLSATPGSTHTFGLTILAEFFTRAGWDVQHEVSTSWQNLNESVSGQWFDMVGISVAKAADVLDLASAIKTLRMLSVNPRLMVMVGGPASTLVTDLARVSGADLTARDAAGAVEMANRWMGIDVLSS